jgi:hypothetical protein
VLDDSNFRALGVSLDWSKIPDHGRVDNVDCPLMPVRKIAGFATGWMREHGSDPSR